MMEQNSAGPKGRAGEVILIVPLEGELEQPGWRAWQEGREERGKGLHKHWEARWRDFLKEPNSSQMGSGKESSPWEDAKAFLASFEQVAKACRWPREEWVARLLPAFSEAQEAFGSLEARDRKDYGKVKAAILRWEANRMETLRQNFRQFRSQEVEDSRKIYSQLQELCRRWLRPERHSKEQILELLILEQFLAILPPELQSWIRAGGPENCTQAAALMDNFLLSQQGGETRIWQGVHLGCLDASETLLGPAETQSYEEAEQAEISLPDSEIQWDPHSSSSLPPERQERAEAGQMKALGTLEETGLSLQRTEQNLTQEGAQGTMFWQVLPDSSGKVDSLSKGPSHQERLLIPRAGLPFHLEREEERSLRFPEERGTFPSQASSDEKGGQSKVGNPSHGGNKPRDLEKTQGHMPVVAEIQVEIGESKGKQKKKSLQGQNKSQGFLEGLRAVHSQTHPAHPRMEEPLFSRYGRRYHLASGFVTELTRGDRDECSTSEETSDLDEHQRISTGENYKYPKVKGSFTKGDNLRRNQRGHTGERKSDCPENGKSFTPKTSMRHLKTHREQRIYTCPVCEKGMKWKQDLTRHLRIHTGEKPYKCPECSLSFSRTECLSKHQKSHGRKKPYECPQCGKDFHKKSRMFKHQRFHK